jgi:membrane fusion protein, multidrug efflux system
VNQRITTLPDGALEIVRGWLRWVLERPLRIGAAVGLALGLFVVLALALGRGASDAVGLGSAAQTPALELLEQDVATVEVRPLSRRVPITGTVEPRDWTEVKAQIGGEIASVAVRSGESVKRGQVLARLDARDLKARLADKRAALAGARAQLELSSRKRDTTRAMFARELVAQMELDSAESAYRVSEASVRSLQAQVDQASKAVEDSEIRSPLEGVVAERSAQVGSAVTPGSKLFTVMDLSTLELTALVPASDIPSVRVGQEVDFQVEGFGERSFSGSVERINPSTEPGSRSIAIYVQIANAAGELRGGMFAQGSLRIAESAEAKVIPESALHEEGGKAFVFLIEGDRLARREVEVAVRDATSGRVGVASGLEAGDRVIVSALANLQTGTPVRVTELDSPKP